MKKKETALKKMLDKYHQVENSKVGTAKNIQLLSSSTKSGQKSPKNKMTKNELLHNKSQSNEIVAVKEIRNKNLEQMLKKLNSEHNYDNLHSSTNTNNIISNNNSYNNINKSFHSQNNNRNGSFYSVNARSEIYMKDENDEESKNILSLLRKSKIANQSNKSSQKLFTKTADTVIVLPYTQTINQNSTINNSSNNNTITNQSNQNEIIKTSKETTNVVKSIDEKIKQLKLKFLRDTHIDIKRLSKYTTTLVKLYSFLTSYEIHSIYHSCKFSHDNFKSYLNLNVYKYILNPFTEIYNNKFRIEKSKIISKFGKDNFNVTLVIRGNILLSSDYEDQTIEIENYYSMLNHPSIAHNKDNQFFRNIYRFDYKYKTYHKQIWWIIKEKTYFNYDDVNKAYAMAIVPFKFGDSFEMSISLISNSGMINFEQFYWKKMKSMKNSGIDYINYNNLMVKKEKDKQLCDFDLSRYCEMELIKTKWNNFSKFPNNENNIEIKNEISNFYNKLAGYFTIEDIEYDDVGFYIFKIYAKAIYMGQLSENDIGINIDIKGNKEPCCNEIRKNGLICDIGRGIEIRLGDRLVFSLTMNKIIKDQ